MWQTRDVVAVLARATAAVGVGKPLILAGAICAAMGAAATSASAALDSVATDRFGDSARSGGTVVVGLASGGEPRTLNTLTLEGNAANGSYVLQPVVTFASKYNHRGTLIHDLLEDVTVNNRSPLVVTYRIKRAAKWNDNRPVSAEDMIFTYRQIMNPDHDIISRVGFEDIGRIRKVTRRRSA